MELSPDGSHLALVLVPPEDGDRKGNAVIVTMATDGSDVQVLVRVGPGGELVAERPASQSTPRGSDRDEYEVVPVLYAVAADASDVRVLVQLEGPLGGEEGDVELKGVPR